MWILLPCSLRCAVPVPWRVAWFVTWFFQSTAVEIPRKYTQTNVHRCWFFWPSHLKTNRSLLRIYDNHAKQLEAIAK